MFFIFCIKSHSILELGVSYPSSKSITTLQAKGLAQGPLLPLLLLQGCPPTCVPPPTLPKLGADTAVAGLDLKLHILISDKGVGHSVPFLPNCPFFERVFENVI